MPTTLPEEMSLVSQSLPNGLQVALLPMSALSAGLAIALPMGVDVDPAGHVGCAGVMSDWLLRGAGTRDSRRLIDALDDLGLQRSNSVGTHFARYHAAGAPEAVLESLPIYADILRRPLFETEQFELAREQAIQALEGLDDDPRQKVLVLLRKAHLPQPLGRNVMGEVADLEALTADVARQHAKARLVPTGTIICLAGDIAVDAVMSELEHWFGDWQGTAPTADVAELPAAVVEHHQADLEQTQIGVAWDGIAETDDRYYVMRLAMEALAGGASTNRLNVEIREKRGLVYSVWGGYRAYRGGGMNTVYAGASPEAAQQTLDEILRQLDVLAEGLSADELELARVSLKSSTVLAGESSSAQSAGAAYDLCMRGRVRTLSEIVQGLDAVTLDEVNAFVHDHRPTRLTVVTLGREPLKISENAK